MRASRLVPAFVALFFSTAALAQDWSEYINRQDFFEINLPDDPMITSVPYKTLKGVNLTAHVFSASAPSNSILAGKYSVMVVDYSNAKDEIATALEQARQMIRAKGTVKYDDLNNLDLHLTRRITIETKNSRILAEILMAANNRLYITQAENSLNAPPAANFQASLQILDENGVRIRTRTTLGVPEGVTSKISAGGVPEESDRIASLMAGTWRTASGACEAAYFKSADRVKTKRGEQALAGTVVNMGKTVSGELILDGSREGQFIDPANDQAIMLFDAKGGKLRIAAIGGAALGWPDVTLDSCPAARG